MCNQTKIVELNDQLRTAFRGGRVQMTPAVHALDPSIRGRALSVLSRYNKFSNDDDHQGGVFIFAGYSFEWHIEYRALDGNGPSRDPANPDCTLRVLTLYLARDLLAAS